MEKIQSAINKARAERQGQPAPKHAPIAGTSQVNQDLWDGLHLVEPSIKRLRAQRIVTLDKTRDAAGFDKLRTRILQQMHANGWKRLAITSPGPSSGKSTTVLNLGFSLSRQVNSRVIVSEMDLRKPSLRRIMQIKTDRDYTRVLTGASPFEKEALRVRKNLIVGMAQNFVDNSAEILQDAGLSNRLDAIEQAYDPTLMMFDMPPFQVSDDTMAFVDKVDCVLIIAAAETTRIEELDVCEREIAGVSNVLGVVLNKCRYATTETNYEYYG